MASTFSTRLRMELIGIGDQDGSWGTTANTNIGTLLEEAISGVASVTHDDTASYTLTANNGATDEARQMVLEIGGTLTAQRNVVCPTQEKFYVVNNKTAGGFGVVLKTSGGTGITVPSGKTMILYCDGTNVVDAVNSMSSLTLASALPVASGGTGGTSAAAARTALGLAIGTDVQAQDATLASVAALGTAADKMAYTTGVDTWAETPITAAGRALLDDAAASNQRATLGLVIGTDVQADLAVPSQAEAEAGAATTERVWTAQRIGQAIAALAAGGFASGTKMLFQQTAAPTGWTKDATHNDKALRIVSGAVSSGGATAFATVFGSGKITGSTAPGVASHAHSYNEMTGFNMTTGGGSGPTTSGASSTGAAGSGSSHTHTMGLDLQYVDVIVATKD